MLTDSADIENPAPFYLPISIPDAFAWVPEALSALNAHSTHQWRTVSSYQDQLTQTFDFSFNGTGDRLADAGGNYGSYKTSITLTVRFEPIPDGHVRFTLKYSVGTSVPAVLRQITITDAVITAATSTISNVLAEKAAVDLYNAAVNCGKRGDWSGAVKTLMVATRFWRDPEYFIMYGTALSGAGADQEAEHAFREAAQLSPGNWKAWYYLGGILYDLGRVKDAKDAFNQALACNPDPQTAEQMRELLRQI